MSVEPTSKARRRWVFRWISGGRAEVLDGPLQYICLVTCCPDTQGGFEAGVVTLVIRTEILQHRLCPLSIAIPNHLVRYVFLNRISGSSSSSSQSSSSSNTTFFSTSSNPSGVCCFAWARLREALLGGAGRVLRLAMFIYSVLGRSNSSSSSSSEPSSDQVVGCNYQRKPIEPRSQRLIVQRCTGRLISCW
jgi:hypothetical protein